MIDKWNVDDVHIDSINNTGAWKMKEVGSINDKKNIVLTSHRFITPTHNAFTPLVENDNNDNNNANNLYATVSVLKQKKMISFSTTTLS